MESTISVPEAELHDPDVLTDEEIDALVAGAPWRRFLVVGDSIAKGLGEESPGYRTMRWGERVAAALERARPGLEYLNLGTPDQTASEIRDTQLARAREFEPDLAAYVGGGNDMLVEQFRVEPIAAAIDETISALAEAGATVVTFSMLDLPSAFPVPGMEVLDRRLRILNDAVAEIAERHATVHVDAHSLPCCSDPGLYSSDMKHGSIRGQAIVASVTLERLAEQIPAHGGARR
jgi:lysophospholipase L1-like esterase